MCNELTSFISGRSQTETIYDIVETEFEELKELLTGLTLLTLSACISKSELLLEYAVETLCLLLLTKLYAIL